LEIWGPIDGEVVSGVIDLSYDFWALAAPIVVLGSSGS
jgi:hypothetical protein